MKICGRCVYAIFGITNCCLVPYTLWDSRRNKSIQRKTECFAVEWYAETSATKLKRAAYEEKQKLLEKEIQNGGE